MTFLNATRLKTQWSENDDVDIGCVETIRIYQGQMNCSINKACHWSARDHSLQDMGR